MSDFEGIDWVDPKDMPEAEQEPKKLLLQMDMLKLKLLNVVSILKKRMETKA